MKKCVHMVNNVHLCNRNVKLSLKWLSTHLLITPLWQQIFTEKGDIGSSLLPEATTQQESKRELYSGWCWGKTIHQHSEYTSSAVSRRQRVLNCAASIAAFPMSAWTQAAKRSVKRELVICRIVNVSKVMNIIYKLCYCTLKYNRTLI